MNALTKGWLASWQKNGWRTANKKSVANRDLWERLISLVEKRKINPTWVRGHDGHKENEICDELAVTARDNGPYEKDIGYVDETQTTLV